MFPKMKLFISQNTTYAATLSDIVITKWPISMSEASRNERESVQIMYYVSAFEHYKGLISDTSDETSRGTNALAVSLRPNRYDAHKIGNLIGPDEAVSHD